MRMDSGGRLRCGIGGMLPKGRGRGREADGFCLSEVRCKQREGGVAIDRVVRWKVEGACGMYKVRAIPAR